MKILNSSEKKQIQRELEEKYKITKFNYLLFQTGKNKIRGYSGNLSREELSILARTARIEVIGLYLLRQENETRLSLDATHILKPTKNIININDEQAKQWMRGQDLILETNKKGFVIIKHDEDFLGSGLSTGTLIKNFIPKERRLK